MKTAKYSAYKPSGIEWLGDVPEHWRIDRLKASIVSCRNGIWGDEAQGDENDIPCVRVADFDRQKLRVELDEPTIRSVTGKERSGRLLSKGDLLLEKSGGGENQPVGCVVLYDDARPAVCSNFVARVVVANDQHSSYWRYVHAAAYAVRLTVGSINQTSGIQNLDQARYFNEYVAFPPPTEQAAIAAFLDRETAKIDALVEEQKRLIELLKEKRQAVISQAVTKGLDQSVPMKDSGVECLGEVPAHWQVRPLKKCIAFQEGPGIMAADFQDDGVPLLRISCVQSEAVTLAGCNYLDPDKVARQWSHFRVEIGDLLISGSASMGVVSEVGEEAEGAVPYTGLMRLQSRHGGMLKDFIKHLVVSDSFMRQVQLLKTGSTIQHFGPTHLNHMLVVLPPEDEQEAIATFLTSENRRMDSLRAEAEAGMALLEERRSALISAAVTGKIDVRGLAPQPEVTAA